MKSFKILLITLLMIGALDASELQFAPRTQWFKDAKFGMFIHWGIYSQYAGVYQGRSRSGYSAWILHNEKIPLTDYKATAKTFNPVKYDAEAWAEVAKQAGVKYLVITAKHHDGFALFETKFSDWSVMRHSQYGEDLIQPLAEACRKRGIRFGIYYSQALDWINGGAQSKPKFASVGWDSVDYDHYLKTISLPQTREILDQYNPDLLWWDMPQGMTPERAVPFEQLLTEYPNVLTNNRLGGKFLGDFATFEQSIPAAPKLDEMWESCMTMNHTWGYKEMDHEWKSTKELLHNLIGSVSKGGNFLLNIGPDGEGSMPAASLERLAQMGEWLKENGEAIYGADATPFLFQQAWRGATTRRRDGEDTLLYLHLYDWPIDGTLRVLGVKNAFCRASLLVGRDKQLSVQQDDNGWLIQLPKEPPSQYSSTVVLRVPGELKVEHDGFLMTADGVVLVGLDAQISGPNPRKNTKNNFINGIKPATEVSWKIDIPEAGAYMLRGNVGSVGDRQMRLSMAGQEQLITIPNTHVQHYGGGNFPSVGLGVVEIKKSGTYVLRLKPSGDDWGQGIALQSLMLKAVSLGQDENGNIALPALSANGLETYAGYNGAIRSPQLLTWDFLITREAGNFSVVIDYSSDRAIDAALKCGQEILKVKLPTTFGAHRRLKVPFGSLSVSSSGANQLMLGGDCSGMELYGLNLYIGTQLQEQSDAVTIFPHASAVLWDTGHSELERWRPANAVDGERGSAWRVPYKTKFPQELQVDYGKEQTFNHLSLSTENPNSWNNIQGATLRMMTIEGWKDIAEIKNAGISYELDFPAQTGRFFQLHVHRANILAVYEFKLSQK